MSEGQQALPFVYKMNRAAGAAKKLFYPGHGRRRCRSDRHFSSP
jgi:hypothetical protein